MSQKSGTFDLNAMYFSINNFHLYEELVFTKPIRISSFLSRMSFTDAYLLCLKCTFKLKSGIPKEILKKKYAVLKFFEVSYNTYSLILMNS